MAVEVLDNREGAGIDLRKVGLLGIGFVLFVTALVFGLYFYYRHLVDVARIDQTLATFPVPQIQPNPTQDYLGFRRRQNEQLAGYAWIDRSKNLIHVPIGRAIDLMAAKGAAAYDPPDPPSSPGAAPTTGIPPDGAPRAKASLPASPYGTRP